MRTLKVLSTLLDYPTAELVAAASELKSVLAAEGVLRPAVIAGVNALIDDLAARDLYDSQERYILLFDRTRSLSLHLFEHVHGESRDRGQAMVDLLRVYEEAGVTPTASQLPDFLPLFLEFASTLEPAAAVEQVAEPAHILAALGERLKKRSSPYAAVFDALVALSQARIDAAMLKAIESEADPEPDDLEALDAAWQDEEVKFGPDAAADCGVDSLAAKIRQGRRPAPGVETPRDARRPRVSVTTSSPPRT